MLFKLCSLLEIIGVMCFPQKIVDILRVLYMLMYYIFLYF